MQPYDLSADGTQSSFSITCVNDSDVYSDLSIRVEAPASVAGVPELPNSLMMVAALLLLWRGAKHALPDGPPDLPVGRLARHQWAGYFMPSWSNRNA
jgi:hypothetical protein